MINISNNTKRIMEKQAIAELMEIVSSFNDEMLTATFEAVKIEMQERKVPLVVPTSEQIETVSKEIQEESKALDKINTFYAYETLGVNTYENYLHLVNVNTSLLLKTKGKNKNQPRTEYEGLITVSKAKDREMKGTVNDYNIFISPKNLITLKIEGMVNGGIVSKATLIESGLMTDSIFYHRITMTKQSEGNTKPEGIENDTKSSVFKQSESCSDEVI
tara:strand:- start:477 stop:1130 length:654 start_codon:yes stop_codon:yes gene_type:complete